MTAAGLHAAAMHELPAPTLLLNDGKGNAIGRVRLVLSSETALKGECIFDMRELPADARSEERWLHKRRYQRASEHKFKIDEEGVVKITGPDFKVLFEPTETGDLCSVPPAPRVTASWSD